jgi:glycosyltransferase involved in cell wall biosynthesis
VAEAIESALGQTYPNIEILVINDGSNDGGATDDVVARYTDRVTYIRKENGGVATALNLGIREMHGAYFSWLSHDDFYLPGKIETQIEFLAEHGFPDVVVYSNHFNLIEKTKTVYLTEHAVHGDIEFRAKEIVSNNRIHGCSLLVPRKAFEQAGVFDEKLRVAQDYELWFRIASKIPFRYLDETVATCRIHEKQVGVRMRDRVLIENDEFRLNCLRQLDDSEIRALSGGNRTKGLLHLAMRMYRMGCPLSHEYLFAALKRSVFGSGTPISERFLAFFAMGVDMCHTTAVKVVRKLK